MADIDVWKVAKDIGDLIRSEHKLSSERWDCRKDFRRALHLRLEWETLAARRKVLQARLQNVFATERGWRVSKSGFGPACLALRGAHGHRQPWWPHMALDHPYFFRDGRRAAAAVGHLYDVDHALRSWAEQNRLQLSFPDFPSWYYPDRTRLVLFEPLKDGFQVGAGFRCRLATKDGKMVADWQPHVPGRWSDQHYADWRRNVDEFLVSRGRPMLPEPE